MFGIYQNRKVPLEKIMRGDRKKFKVYVISPSTGRVKKVEFGDRAYKIKRDIDSRRESYRKRHHCDDPSVAKPKDKAEFWSCKTWQKDVSVKQLLRNTGEVMRYKVMPGGFETNSLVSAKKEAKLQSKLGSSRIEDSEINRVIKLYSYGKDRDEKEKVKIPKPLTDAQRVKLAFGPKKRNMGKTAIQDWVNCKAIRVVGDRLEILRG